MQRRRLLPLLLVPLLWARQPDPVALRHIYEDALAKRERAYGSADARTAAAARDLGLYLRQWGDDSASSQQALREALAIDEQALGKDDPQTMSDAVNLASITSPQEAELLWKRVSESSDNELSSRVCRFRRHARGCRRSHWRQKVFPVSSRQTRICQR